MNRLLSSELFKLWKNTTFKVLIIVSIVLGVLAVGATKLASSEEIISGLVPNNLTEEQKEDYINNIKEMSKPTNEIAVSGNLGFSSSSEDIFNPKGREVFFTSFGAGVIEIFIVILAGTLVAKEYSKGTIRNTIAYGNKRYKYFLSKVMSVSLSSIICFLTMVLTSTIIGSFLFDWGNEFNSDEIMMIIKSLVCAILIIISVSTIMVFIASILKSNGVTIAIGMVVFVMVIYIIGAFYGKFDTFDAIYKYSTAYNWASISRVNASLGDYKRTIISSLVTILGCLAVGSYVVEKQDIK